MSFQQEVQQAIGELPADAIFYSTELPFVAEKRKALNKALGRLTATGILVRIEPGFYGKTCPSVLGLGSLGPSIYEIIPKLLEHQKHNTSYLTGNNVYTGYGLTTQVSKEDVIATDRPRKPLSLPGRVEVRFIRSRVTEPVEDEDIMLVQLLDALCGIEHISATTPFKATRVLLGWFRKLTPTQRLALGGYALSYPPQTRALTGLLLETLGKNKRLVQQLQAILDPRKTFSLWLDPETFPTAPSWHFEYVPSAAPRRWPGARSTHV